MILTHSRLRTFRECARKHHIRYEQGWAPARDAEPLRFGTLMHKGLEAFWKNEPILPESDDPFEEAKAYELMAGYISCYDAARIDTYDVLGVEEKFDAPLLNPETMKSSPLWRLGGKLDVVVKVKATGRTALIEHKTTSESLKDADYWALLQIDNQISTYIIGAESLGYTIDDVLYDVIHKPGMRPLLATPIDSRKYLKGTGELYANQRDKDETPEEYGIRLRADIVEDPSKYYQQRLVPRLNSQLKDFMFDAWETAATIRESARMQRAPRNPEACLRYSRCPYWETCTVGREPADYLVKLENVHPELV
jgi:hypothetical protein